MTFKFTEILDFERHIALSIPNYDGLVEIVSPLALEYLTPDGVMLDIGCSSGGLLNSISKNTDSALFGCDLVDMGYEKKYKFTNESGEAALSRLTDIDVITCLFTLQFMGLRERARTIAAMRHHMDLGAVVILAEKVHLNNSRLNTCVHRAHHRKKNESFSADEIFSKDAQLSGSMFPLESDQLSREMSSLGCYELIWQSYNFRCWVIYKPNPKLKPL